MRRLSLPVFTAVAVLLAAAGCGDLKSAVFLARDLNREFHAPVNVKITNRSHLQITFDNVPAARLKDSASSNDFAYLVAQFAKAHYPTPDSLKDVTIEFASVSSFGPVKVTRRDQPYVFAIRDIR